MISYEFMRNALVAVIIITPLFALLGTMIVNKKMAYFSDALGHSALTGIAVGVMCGMRDTTVSMIIFAIILLWLACVYFQLVFIPNISLFVISVALLVETCFSF